MTRAALTLALVAVLTAHPADATVSASLAPVTQVSDRCNSGTYSYATINAPCVWDGRHGANSRSFVVSYAADFYYIRHIRAHCMLRAHEAGACPGGKR